MKTRPFHARATHLAVLACCAASLIAAPAEASSKKNNNNKNRTSSAQFHNGPHNQSGARQANRANTNANRQAGRPAQANKNVKAAHTSPKHHGHHTHKSSASKRSSSSVRISIGGGYSTGYGRSYHSAPCPTTYRYGYSSYAWPRYTSGTTCSTQTTRIHGPGYSYGTSSTTCYPSYTYTYFPTRVTYRSIDVPETRVSTQTRIGTYYTAEPEYRSWQREVIADQQSGASMYADRTTQASPLLLDEQSDRAWRILAGGDFADAQAAFAALCDGRPDDAKLKTGFALSCILSGAPDTGVWAMRRAIIADPDNFGLLPDDEVFDVRLAQAARAVRYDADPRLISPADRWFLIACLDFLAGDHEAARESIDRAIALGDDHISTSALNRRIAP